MDWSGWRLGVGGGEEVEGRQEETGEEASQFTCDLIFSGKSEVLSSAESHIQVLIEKHLSPFCGSRRHFQGLARAIGHNMAKGTLRTSCPRGALPASTALLVPKVQETDVVTLGLLSLPSSPTVKTSSHQLQKHNTHQVLMRK